MRIGVSGASGQLGASTVAELVRRGGHEIVGISRSPERVTAPVTGRLGDYDRPETLAAAYAGLDRLLIIPSSEMGRDGAPGVVVGAILSIQEKFVEGGFDIVTGDVERLAGRAPRALRDLLAGALSGR